MKVEQESLLRQRAFAYFEEVSIMSYTESISTENPKLGLGLRVVRKKY
jgi:hypothetical protein